jgi:hypothetical protein
VSGAIYGCLHVGQVGFQFEYTTTSLVLLELASDNKQALALCGRGEFLKPRCLLKTVCATALGEDDEDLEAVTDLCIVVSKIQTLIYKRWHSPRCVARLRQ